MLYKSSMMDRPCPRVRIERVNASFRIEQTLSLNGLRIVLEIHPRHALKMRLKSDDADDARIM